MPPKPKTGEGIVVVLDVGRGVCSGTETTFFTRAKDCLRFILQRKIFADKCYDAVGIVLFGTAGTNNQLATGNQYQHVTVLQEVRLVEWEMMKQVENLGHGGSSGDWLDALVVAMDLLHDPDGKRFTGKKIVLLTDFSGEFSDDQSSAITSGLLSERIELVVIGPDILKDLNEEDEDANQPGPSEGDSTTSTKPSLNWNGKPKTIVQKAGEAVVARIVAKVDGMLCSFEDALPQLMFYEKKNQASAAWNTTLDFSADFKIPITGRIKVRDVTLPTWKKGYSGNPTAVIQKEVSYHLYDEKQTAVPSEEVISGYFYGTTLVPVSDEDMKMAYKSNSPRSMAILGFTKSKNVPHWIRAGNQVLAVTARDNDDAAAVALSSVIQAMVEMDMVAISRRVYSQNLNPRLGVLLPEITKDYECLLWIQLPFIQDVERLIFPSLQPRIDKLKDEEKDAIDSLIDAMDLSRVKGEDEDDDEDEDEVLDPTTVLNPQMQHFYNVLTHRALNPRGKLPEPAPHILKILEPPEMVCEARDKVVPTLKKLFPTQTPSAPKRAQNVFDVQDDKEGSEKRAKVDNSLSASDLIQHQVTQVTTASPVQDFMALLRGEAPNFNDICRQMGDVVLQLVDSLAGASSGPVAAAMLDKILDCLTTFHQESCSIDPATYNRFLTTRLKDVVVSLSLTDLWGRIKDSSLGLITGEENGRSSVSKEEASIFLQLDQGTQEAAPPAQDAGDEMEDLLDDL